MANPEAELEQGDVVRGLKILTATPGPLLERIGVVLLAQAQRAFTEQGKGPNLRWPERMNPNIAGVLRDLDSGGAVRPRRFQGRPALIDTGELRRSLKFVVRGRSVEVVSTVPYANTMQQGGPSTIEITDAMRRNAPEAMNRYEALREVLPKVLRKKTLTINVRPRPFLLITDQDLQELSEEITEFAAEFRGTS